MTGYESCTWTTWKLGIEARKILARRFTSTDIFLVHGGCCILNGVFFLGRCWYDPDKVLMFRNCSFPGQNMVWNNNSEFYFILFIFLGHFPNSLKPKSIKFLTNFKWIHYNIFTYSLFSTSTSSRCPSPSTFSATLSPTSPCSTL